MAGWRGWDGVRSKYSHRHFAWLTRINELLPILNSFGRYREVNNEKERHLVPGRTNNQKSLCAVDATTRTNHYFAEFAVGCHGWAHGSRSRRWIRRQFGKCVHSWTGIGWMGWVHRRFSIRQSIRIRILRTAVWKQNVALAGHEVPRETCRDIPYWYLIGQSLLQKNHSVLTDTANQL